MSNTALLGSYGAQDNSSLMFRNKVINGCMRIDQRNAGAAVTITNSAPYTVDRWLSYKTNATVVATVQRSTVAPSSFTNSALITVTTGAATGASDNGLFSQYLEGFNVADLAWGTADAKPVTISFWVRSSSTGTFGLGFQNSAQTRNYMASYTINSANTWEQKIVTIIGDTTGTWLTDNNVGLRMNFDLGAGSSASLSSGTWSTNTANNYGLTGGVKLFANSGATLYITGVQLEAGPTATPFERRPIGVELALAQRYYITGSFSFSILTAVLSTAEGWSPFKVSMRATPAVSLASVSQSSIAAYAATASQISTEGFSRANNSSGNFANSITPVSGTYTASAEL